ncbi:beta/gamma crystallin-related protein [Brevundimonas sp. R86498]|uniref:beta/gamma crystallin-related protein n=1 Tax=Brevundimonas sp. R86498 TaxID=3093845 RepID=UPI0037CA3B2B
MRVLLAAMALAVVATPALAQRAADAPNWIPGQSRSTITIYTQQGLQGDATMFTRDQSHISGGERAVSLETKGGAWEVCDGVSFTGQCRVAEGWTMNLRDLGLRRVRSIRPIVSTES